MEMTGVLGHDSALGRLSFAGDNLGYVMNFVMNHAPGAGSTAGPVDQLSSALPLYHGYPPYRLVIFNTQGEWYSIAEN